MNWSIEGVLQALDLWDVDTSPGVLDVSEEVQQFVGLGDLSLNYRAPVLQRLASRVTLAPSPGNFGGAALTNNRGLWVRGVYNLSANLLHIGVSPDRTYFDSIALSPILWNKVGSSSGEAANLQQAGTFESTFGFFATASPTAPSWTIQNGAPDIGYFPLWVPAGTVVHIVNSLVNANTDFCMAVQVPASEERAWP